MECWLLWSLVYASTDFHPWSPHCNWREVHCTWNLEPPGKWVEKHLQKTIQNKHRSKDWRFNLRFTSYKVLKNMDAMLKAVWFSRSCLFVKLFIRRHRKSTSKSLGIVSLGNWCVLGSPWKFVTIVSKLVYDQIRELIQPTLGPQNHEKWRFWTPNIWVITPKNEGFGFPW